MLAPGVDSTAAFTRRDAIRLAIAAGALVAVLTAILAVDLLPQAAFTGGVGDLAPAAVYAPRATTYTSGVATDAAREEARRTVDFVYDYSPASGQLSAAQQLAAYDRTVAPIDAAFGAVLSDEARLAALATAIEGLTPRSIVTLQELDGGAWTDLRLELANVLDAAQRQEVRDTDLPGARAALASRVSLGFPEPQRVLGGEILAPLLVANSSYDAPATEQAREQAAAAVEPTVVDIKQGELIVQAGARLTEADLERLGAIGVLDAAPDPARIVGWLLLSALTVALFLGWVWRFRPAFWHRNNVLLLVSLFLIVTTFALRATSDRLILPFFLPLAATALLTTILLDAGAAVVLSAMIGVLASVVSGSVELGVVRRAGLAGRRGHRASGRTAPAVRPGGGAHGPGQRGRHRHLRVARRARPDRDPAARGRRHRGGHRGGCRGRRHVLVAGQRLRLHDLVPAARAGQSIAAAAAPAAARDGWHVPPLADGRQPRRAGSRGDRRRSAPGPRRRLLPRRRQAGQSERVHREPGW